MNTILIIPGDGIGQEIMVEAERILKVVSDRYNFPCRITYGIAGGASIDAHGQPLTEATLQQARQADAILFGAIGGPQWDSLPPELKPETGLLQLRSQLNLFANLRPARLFNALTESSSLKPELVTDLDMLIVRELTGGAYFGTPRGVTINSEGKRQGVNSIVYDEDEVRRIAQVAFTLAMQRNKKLCSVDKANVLEVTAMWRDVVNELAVDYPEVELSHMYVDNAAMQLVRQPKQFDVIVTENMFGDILSDCAAMLTGSIGMLPSASLDSNTKGMYEPVHGSAPDIAGQGIANPIASILCVSMMLHYTFNRSDIAQVIEQAVAQILDKGMRTADIALPGETISSTSAVGDALVDILSQPKESLS